MPGPDLPERICARPACQRAGGRVLAPSRLPDTVPGGAGKIGNAFRQAMARYAEANGIPWIKFAKGDRKIDVIRPYPDAADRTGGRGSSRRSDRIGAAVLLPLLGLAQLVI